MPDGLNYLDCYKQEILGLRFDEKAVFKYQENSFELVDYSNFC